LINRGELVLETSWLVDNRDLGQSRQVDKRQSEDDRGVAAQVENSQRDCSVLAGIGFDIANEFVSNLVEVGELLLGLVQEFTPCLGIGYLSVDLSTPFACQLQGLMINIAAGSKAAGVRT
jgi:hypothetical protein